MDGIHKGDGKAASKHPRMDPRQRRLTRTMKRCTARHARCRPAPGYDLDKLPNDGNLLYERHDLGMTGARWLELARAALVRLELE
jgi:hypothetical protein